MIGCVEVALLIPDNEARTALAVLQRLGVGVVALERADLYRCDIADDAPATLVETLRGIESVFNPNKHVIRSRETVRPGAGEVWIDEIASECVAGNGDLRVAGRVVAGLRRLERFTAWRLATAPGVAAEAAVVGAATELLFCNPAFQKAVRE